MKSHIVRSSIPVLLFSAILLSIAAPAPAENSPAKDESVEIRGGQAPYPTVESILENPTKVDMQVTAWEDNGFHKIRSVTDYHVVYPVPMKHILDVLLDYEGTKEVYPRVDESVIEKGDSDPRGMHTVRIHVSIKVFGFGGAYSYITNNYVEPYGDGYIQRYDLQRSPDGRFFQMSGNWYVEELEYGDEPHTYLRQYSVVGIRKGSLPMEVAMRTFGGINLRYMFGNVYDAALKRFKAGQSRSSGKS